MTIEDNLKVIMEKTGLSIDRYITNQYFLAEGAELVIQIEPQMIRIDHAEDPLPNAKSYDEHQIWTVTWFPLDGQPSSHLLVNGGARLEDNERPGIEVDSEDLFALIKEIGFVSYREFRAAKTSVSDSKPA